MGRHAWDEKYRGEHGRRVLPPEPLLLRGLAEVGAPAGDAEALDLACGTGRHALELARRGWRTEGWDVSSVALGILAERAAEAGLAVATRAVDLEDPGEQDAALRAHGGRFALVTVVHYLDRPLFERAHELVAPGGHVVLSTFTEDWTGERPSARFRLARGELADGLPGLAPRLYLEEDGRALLVARRASERRRASIAGGSGRTEA